MYGTGVPDCLTAPSSSKIALSPFAQCPSQALWHADSCPPKLWEQPSAEPEFQDGLREQFLTPEARDGFTVLAYRPYSLPIGVDALPEVEEEEEEGGMLIRQRSERVSLDWREVDAVSLVGSPMQRTDKPLSRFAPPLRRSVAAIKRMSMDETIRSGREFQELSVRSSSLPASYAPVVVDELWAGIPQPAFANPFNGLEDNCGFFRH